MPLVLLFAIAVTGMALTASSLWWDGALLLVHLAHPPGRRRGLAAVDPVRQVLPHRPAAGEHRRPPLPDGQSGRRRNRRRSRQPLACRRCATRELPSAQFIADLKATLRDLGQNYDLGDERGVLQDYCPTCKRVLRAARPTTNCWGSGFSDERQQGLLHASGTSTTTSSRRASPHDAWDGEHAVPETLVPTHCCFCGVQCGMYLRVADGKVTGVEPRDYPHNRGSLCPKGVVAYQQVEPPRAPAPPADPPRRKGRAARARDLGRGARLRRPALAGDPGEARPRRGRRLQRLVDDEREVLPRRASSPGSGWAPATSTTTAASACPRRRWPTRRRSASTARRCR